MTLSASHWASSSSNKAHRAVRRSHAWLPWLIASTLSVCEGTRRTKGGTGRGRVLLGLARGESFLHCCQGRFATCTFGESRGDNKYRPNNTMDDMCTIHTLCPSVCLAEGQRLYFIRETLPRVSIQNTEWDDEPAVGVCCSLILINIPLIGRWLNVHQLEGREAGSHKNA